MKSVNLGFLPKVIEVSLDNLLPLKSFSSTVTNTAKFRQIVSSIKAVGLIEPFIVASLDRHSGKHPLLDGHLRLAALRELGHTSVACLISTDDEAYTYNKQVNRLSTIQEHWMLRRAVDRGVSPERLANALAVDIKVIVSKLHLLQGICSEALHVLRDREFSTQVAASLRKMKPSRQIECAEMMVAANCMTVRYAQALLAATPNHLLLTPRRKSPRVSQDQINQLERETENLRARYRVTELTYADDMLNLVVAKGYVGKLLAHPAIESYLRKWHADLFPELLAVVSLNSVDE
jgi:hypothetical protein